MKIPECCWKQIDVLKEYNIGRFYSDWVYKKKWYIFISWGYHDWCVEVHDLPD